VTAREGWGAPPDAGGNQAGCDWWNRIKISRTEANSGNGLERGRERDPGRERGRSPTCQLRRVALRVPDLDAVGIFMLRNLVHGADEAHRAGGFLQAALEAFDMGEQAAGGQGGEVALGEFGLGGAELGAELLQARFAGGEQFVEAVFPLNGGEVGDGVLVLAAPGDERGLGDVEFGGDAGEDPALNPEVNETLDGFLGVHTVLSGRYLPAWGPQFLVCERLVSDVAQTRLHAPVSHPLPPGKAQRKLWKQPHALTGEPRPPIP